MTPSEFKAWFDGFTEAFSGCPTKAQWCRIKERVAEIDGKSVTERVYVDRYWPTYVRSTPNYPPNWTTTYCSSVGVATGGMGLAQNTSSLNQVASGGLSAFNSTAAMGDLGRAEAKSLAS